MRNYKFKFTPIKRLVSKQETWIRGLDVLVSPTQIKPNELAEATDCQLIEDGKIQCPRDGQAYYGASNGTRVRGIFSYYKSDGTKQLLRTVGTHLQLYVSASTWTNVSGYTYTNDLTTNGVTAYDRLYINNGTDPLTYYDGTSITSFTAIGSPSTPTATPTRGTAGTNSYTYSYKITATTAVGETNVSTAGTCTLAVSQLSTTDYVSLSWPTVASATGYNIYGRKDGQWFFMKSLEGVNSTSYVDKNQDTPNEAMLPPSADGTAGPKGAYVAVYKDTLFVAGDPANPSRMYYSGGGDKINDFTVGGGGGLIDIAKNDGQVITGLIVFKNTLLIFKEDSIYQFSFDTSGLPSLAQTNPAVGAIAPRSIIAVENDIFFASRRGIFTIGNEPGFAFDVLRTNELSSRVRSIYQSTEPTRMKDIAAIYTSDANKNLVIFSYTPSGGTYNSQAIVYDRERLAWYKWTNIQANCWTIYRGTDGITHYLYGDDNSGYIKEILTGTTDFGNQIHGFFSLNGESFGAINQYKILKDLDLVLRKPSGSISYSVYQDGIEEVYSTNIGTISPALNFGHYIFKEFLFKDTFGTGTVSSDQIVIRTKKNVNIEGKTFQHRFDNNSSSNFILLFAGMTANPRNPRYRHSSDLIGSSQTTTDTSVQLEDLLV